MASDIQKSMLPRSIPNLRGYEIFANLIPAKTVGGDFYDFIPLGEDSIAIAIGRSKANIKAKELKYFFSMYLSSIFNV